MGKIGITEILLIAVLVLILFGGKKIPEFFRGLGTGIKEFKKSMKEDEPGAKGNDPATHQ